MNDISFVLGAEKFPVVIEEFRSCIPRRLGKGFVDLKKVSVLIKEANAFAGGF